MLRLSETERIALVLVGSSIHKDCDGIVTRQAFEETWTPAILLKYKKTANIDAEQLSSSEDEMTRMMTRMEVAAHQSEL